MIAHYCDRCGAELWNSSTGRVQPWPVGQVLDGEGRSVWELCESCMVELRHWIEQMAEVREGRRL